MGPGRLQVVIDGIEVATVDFGPWIASQAQMGKAQPRDEDVARSLPSKAMFDVLKARGDEVHIPMAGLAEVKTEHLIEELMQRKVITERHPHPSDFGWIFCGAYS